MVPRQSRKRYEYLWPLSLLAVLFAVDLKPREREVYRLGVLDASVDARVSTATVRFQHQAQSAGELIRVVELLGFQVRFCSHRPHPIPLPFHTLCLPQHCSIVRQHLLCVSLLAGSYPPARLHAFQGVRATTVFLVTGP